MALSGHDQRPLTTSAIGAKADLLAAVQLTSTDADERGTGTLGT
jgi:hypothetical protein